MNSKVFIIVFFTICLKSFGQLDRGIGHNWQMGVGGAIVRFSDEDAPYIGDKHLMQIPRLNVTRRINHNFSVDVALSFGSFDSSLVTNNVPYFSMDISGRYRYVSTIEELDPYIFVGSSIVDSHPRRKTTPTINIGTGVSYWFFENIAGNAQFYYKHSLESFESMRSHIQVSVGVVFGLNLGKSTRRKLGGTSCYYNQHVR